MAVFLSQHGKSAPKEIDPNRGLTEEGAAEVRRVASLLKQGGVSVAGIQHSGKYRAKQTAEIFAAALKLAKGVTACEGINPLDDVTVFATRLDAAVDHLYVGHLPFMQRLVSCLITGDPERSVVTFQNGGVVRLDYNDESMSWIIKWVLVPNLA
ncbi:MAG: phosphohistidine phosphatase SixA [Gammaproteobacteria bacterium]|nr:phosphohistidine phosphatase SixA [Gammaproteobacteria bacterium]